MRLTGEMGREGGGMGEAISPSWNVRCLHDARWDTNNLLFFFYSRHIILLMFDSLGRAIKTDSKI